MERTMRCSLLGFFVVLAGLTTGCGPQVHVLHKSQTGSLSGTTQFVLQPVTFESLQVGQMTETEYLAAKDDDARAAWGQTRMALSDTFATELSLQAQQGGIVMLVGEPSADQLVIVPTVSFIEPGYYVGISQGASKVHMTLAIMTAKGEKLDELVLEHGTPGSMTTPKIYDRVKYDARALAHFVAQHVATRVASAAQ